MPRGLRALRNMAGLREELDILRIGARACFAHTSLHVVTRWDDVGAVSWLLSKIFRHHPSPPATATTAPYWKYSIVDLMAILGIDNSLPQRKALV